MANKEIDFNPIYYRKLPLSAVKFGCCTVSEFLKFDKFSKYMVNNSVLYLKLYIYLVFF